MTTATPSEPSDHDFGHSALTHMIRSLVNVVPNELTAGQRASLVNALTRIRRELPEIYTSCDLDQLARKHDPRVAGREYDDLP